MSDPTPFQSYSSNKIPHQRWQILQPQPETAKHLSKTTGLSPLLTQVLINRGIKTPEQADIFLNPDTQILPSPVDELPDLAQSVELLQNAIKKRQKIAICGDYDADGMTSTALLMRALSFLGADVNYAIPSRMKEGYGINNRIVEEFHHNGIGLILTVDNGISAYQPIARARELGLTVIITDHHDLPPQLPPANAILNPKLIPEVSPYRSLAGVGVAYILAISLAQSLDKAKELVNPLLELFTLGTIADLAPLTGVNRRWVKRGLQRLPHSQITGIQALIQMAGVQQGLTPKFKVEQRNTKAPLHSSPSMKPEDIGFRLGPRINAVGRIANPQIVIELLTTDNMGVALERAMQCEQINQKRQQLCEEIEQEAIAWCENSQIDLDQQRVLVIVQPGWHHGVIGIVASRLVERYGVPVFIGTYEEEEDVDENFSSSPLENPPYLSSEKSQKSTPKKIRGSARGIPEFNVFEALQFCADLLGKFGGHQAAGGFSMPADHLAEFQIRLSRFAHQCLELNHLKPLVTIDVQADLNSLNFELYHQVDQIHPCGIQNNAPVFWTPNVRIVKQRVVGKGHIKLTISQDPLPGSTLTALPTLEAIAWRWGDYFPLPKRLDIAYQLRENNWNGQTSIELEIVGVRLPHTSLTTTYHPSNLVNFYYQERQYSCSLSRVGVFPELRIRNAQGKVLAVQPGQKIGLLGKSRQDAQTIDVSQPFFQNLIQAAQQALAEE